MKVTVLNTSTNTPLSLIGKIAGVSTDKMDSGYDSFIKRAIRCFNDGHMSVFEHVTVTFEIEGISRACSHQLVRHRHIAFTQESQRYVTMDFDLDYIYPSLQDEAYNVYREALKKADDAYHDLIKLGVKPEDVRYILPNAAPTKLIVTTNLASLAYFYKVRTDPHAQWEIQMLARSMIRALRSRDFLGETEWNQYCDLVEDPIL